MKRLMNSGTGSQPAPAGLPMLYDRPGHRSWAGCPCHSPWHGRPGRGILGAIVGKVLCGSFLVFVLGSGVLRADISAVQIRSGATNPAKCNAGVGLGELKLFYNTAGKTYKQCSDTDTWTDLGMTDGAQTFGGVKTFTDGIVVGGSGVSNITPAAVPGSPVAGDFGILAGSPDLFWFFDDTAVRYVIATTNGKMRVFHSFEGVCQDTTASFPFDLAATVVPSAACITGTNTLRRAVLDFDADTDELVEASIWLSDDWTATGGVDVDVEWQAAAITGNVVWAIQTICVADAEAYDPGWNTVSTVTDAAKGTTNQRNIATISGVTVTGCAANERMFFHFYRDGDAGADTMLGDARMIALRFKTRWTP